MKFSNTNEFIKITDEYYKDKNKQNINLHILYFGKYKASDLIDEVDSSPDDYNCNAVLTSDGVFIYNVLDIEDSEETNINLADFIKLLNESEKDKIYVETDSFLIRMR